MADARAAEKLGKRALFPRDVWAPLLGALGVAFVLDLVLQPPSGFVGVVARLFIFLLGAPVPFLIGWFLGKKSWPKRGRALTRALLKRATRGTNRRLLFLTDRPDGRFSYPRRVLEVVGFAAGASIIVAAIMPLLGIASADIVVGFAGTFSLFMLWASFVLVPYWLFAGMGVRQIDPIRWLVEPLSRAYASRMRLSNGALLLVALGAMVNLAFRAGLSQEAALVTAVRSLLGLIASVLIVAATAVAFYQREEHRLVREMEEEAVARGVRDGRGMSDGDFLPRLPPAKPRAVTVEERKEETPLLHDAMRSFPLQDR